MKKIILVLAMLFLTACGGKEKTDIPATTHSNVMCFSGGKVVFDHKDVKKPYQYHTGKTYWQKDGVGYEYFGECAIISVDVPNYMLEK